MKISIVNGHVLPASGPPVRASLAVADGVVVGEPILAGPALRLDATGLLVLPGIVDIHGDAFERSLMPRPGVMIDHAIALGEADRIMVAHGITTAYLSLTATWEPGLRSLQSARDTIAALLHNRSRLSADHLLHVRWETFALDALEDVIGWLDLAPKPLLSFNDHTTQTLANRTDPKKVAKWAERSGLRPAEYLALVEHVAARAGEVPGAIERLAAEARGRRIVMMSHDDRLREDRARFRALGTTIAEFPLTRTVIEDATAHGEPTVLGAPNVLRGGSHTGALTATEMIEAGLCSVLASDYFYPAQVMAAFKLVRDGRQTLEQVWPLVSRNPAEAAGLTDRGTLSPGQRADVIVVDDRGSVPEVVATLAGGRLVHLARGEIAQPG